MANEFVARRGIISLSGITGTTISKSGGTATQYLMADGSVSTLTNPTTGTGTTNYVTKWTGASTLGNSNLINDASGNLGLGVTPSAWATFRALQIGTNYGALSFAGIGGTMITNAFFDGSTYRYLNSDFAAAFEYNISNGGGFVWRQAPSGTAGNAISFTQAMTLDASGRLGIGTASPSAKLNVSGDIHIGDYGSAASRVLDFRTSNSLFTITTDGTAAALGTTISYSWASGGQGALKFNNTAGEVMRLSGTGNVGIGTTSPATKLSVVGGNGEVARLESSPFDAASGNGPALTFQLTQSNGQSAQLGLIKASADTSWGGILTFNTKENNATPNNTTVERMRITSAGNVGIGTTSPSSLLHIESAFGSTGNALRLQNTTTATTGNRLDMDFWFKSGAWTNARTAQISAVTTGTFWPDTDIIFSNHSQASAAGLTERMRITSAGNVGIGTTSPSAKLHVVGGSRMVSTGGITTPLLNLMQSNDANGYYFSVDNALDGRMELRNDAGTTIQTWQRSSGNVGIGTASPDAKLRVSGISNGTQAIFGVVDGRGLEIATVLAAGTNEAGSILNARGAGSGTLILQTEGTERMRITSGGFVNINNTANTTYQLYVNGTIYATGDVIAYSDKSVKTNIRSIENPIQKIMKSRGVLYDRTDIDSKDNMGFIAQELEEQFPELISTDNKGVKGVKYQNAVAVLFEAIKEQQNQINELKNIINATTK